MNRIPEMDIDAILMQVAIETVERLASEEKVDGGENDDVIVPQQHHMMSEPQHNNEESSSILRHRFGASLPQDFQPSPHSVIVGRGKEAKINPGNKRLRSIAMTYLEEYSQAMNDKDTKSRIVSNIVAMVNEASPEGRGFIKRSKENGGKWYHVDNSGAREKVGCLLRDLLAHKYRSSSKSKVARRQKSKQEQNQISKSHDRSGIVKSEEYQKMDPLTEATRISFCSFASDNSDSSSSGSSGEDEFQHMVFGDQKNPHEG